MGSVLQGCGCGMKFGPTSMVSNLVTVLGLQKLFSFCVFYLFFIHSDFLPRLISSVNTGVR